jgi:hypothetical protein
MSTINIKLYDIFRKELHLPDAKAKELVEAIQESTREEITPVVDDLAKTSLVKEEAHKLDIRIEQTKNDIVKWMFGFWLGTIGIALIFYFLKK